MSFPITGEAESDRVLEDPFALLVGMLLDQQYPMDNRYGQRKPLRVGYCWSAEGACLSS